MQGIKPLIPQSSEVEIVCSVVDPLGTKWTTYDQSIRQVEEFSDTDFHDSHFKLVDIIVDMKKMM